MKNNEQEQERQSHSRDVSGGGGHQLLHHKLKNTGCTRLLLQGIYSKARRMDARELVAVAVARDRPRTGRQNMITAFRRERDLESTSNSRPFPLGEPSSQPVSQWDSQNCILARNPNADALVFGTGTHLLLLMAMVVLVSGCVINFDLVDAN